MLLRLLAYLLVFGFWGCESFSSNHRNLDEIISEQPSPTLTSLTQPSISESSNLSERMMIPENAQEADRSLQAEAEPFPTIYFPFNSWEITPEVKDRLDATAKWMTHFSRYELTIEGHADIRGSESYNMVLGVTESKSC